MQSLGINTQLVYYALYSSYTDTTKDGFKTGGKEVVYQNPVSMYANISAQRGSSDFEPFGVDLDYDRTMVTADMTCPIDEHSVLWIGRSTSEPSNYLVRRVAKSLNSITYAIKEVTKS